jgi:hypothetical protein
MKIFKYSIAFLFIILFAAACITDEDNLYSFDYIGAPTNLDAVFDITQDNTGLVTIVPNAEGAQKYLISFGDGSGEPEEYNILEKVTHNYEEGVYQVGITAVGITGLRTEITKEINITYRTPENLEITITKDAVNPKMVSVSAVADYASVMDIYFGDTENEEPVHVLPGEAATHTYAEPGDYIIKVVAKSGGTATLEQTATVTIDAASDPMNLPIDFESFTVNYAFIDFGSLSSEVIDNPDASGINTSAKVAASVKPAGSETWAGTALSLGETMDFSKTLFRVKIWSPKAGAVIKLKVENLTNGDISYEVDALTTMANTWEELEFDFSAIDVSQEYQKVVLFFDFGNVGDDATYYYDDIKLQYDQLPSTFPIENFEGVAPEFTEFGSATVQVIENPDKSGENTTSNVAEFTKPVGAETWAGVFFDIDPALDLDSYNKVRIKTWSPKTGAVVRLKLENSMNSEEFYEVDMSTTTSNVWETLVFDCSAAPDYNLDRIVIFFDFGNAGDDAAYYYDEIELENEGGSIGTMPFQDFEGVVPAFEAFGNIADVEVIANPDVSGANTTANVAKLVKTSGSETWAGALFRVSPALDLDTYSKITFKTWSPKSGAVVKLKLENEDASVTHEIDIPTTRTNAWEDLTYDFSDAPAGVYVKVVVFFDFGNAGDDSVYYYDEFELTN